MASPTSYTDVMEKVLRYMENQDRFHKELRTKLNRALWDDGIDPDEVMAAKSNINNQFDDFRAEDYGPLADDTVKKGHQQRVPYNIIYKPKDLENFREFIYYVVSHRNDFTPVELEYAGYADKSFDDVRLSNNHMRILQGAYKKKNNRDWPYTTKTGYMYKYAETVYWEWFV